MTVPTVPNCDSRASGCTIVMVPGGFSPLKGENPRGTITYAGHQSYVKYGAHRAWCLMVPDGAHCAYGACAEAAS